MRKKLQNRYRHNEKFITISILVCPLFIVSTSRSLVLLYCSILETKPLSLCSFIPGLVSRWLKLDSLLSKHKCNVFFFFFNEICHGSRNISHIFTMMLFLIPQFSHLRTFDNFLPYICPQIPHKISKRIP